MRWGNLWKEKFRIVFNLTEFYSVHIQFMWNLKGMLIEDTDFWHYCFFFYLDGLHCTRAIIVLTFLNFSVCRFLFYQLKLTVASECVKNAVKSYFGLRRTVNSDYIEKAKNNFGKRERAKNKRSQEKKCHKNSHFHYLNENGQITRFSQVFTDILSLDMYRLIHFICINK